MITPSSIFGHQYLSWSCFIKFDLCHTFVPVPSKCLYVHHHISWSFILFSELLRKVVVRFVDIGGIFNQHCLNFFFIIKKISPLLPQMKKGYKIQNLTKCMSLNCYKKRNFETNSEVKCLLLCEYL